MTSIVNARRDELRRRFDAATPLTVGVEEEVMLLDPETLALAPLAGELLERLDARFKPELPRSQLEIVTPPLAGPAEAVAALAGGRRDLAAVAAGLALPAVAAVHPFASPRGQLSESERYRHIRSEYGAVAERQLVASLQVHVAVGGGERTLGVYNALRGHLPEIAALAANGAVYGGEDSGLASVRPLISGLLPRQGVPPPLAGWDEFAHALAWGEAAGTVPEPRLWWWELRPHPGFGTLEVRVPDAQTTIGEAASVIAFVHTLVAWLAARYDGGDLGPPAPSWRIDENRWSAARYGVDGTLADLATGAREPTSERIERLIDELEPVARRLGSAAELAGACALARQNGAARQRAVAAEAGAHGLAAWLSRQFLADSAFGADVERG